MVIKKIFCLLSVPVICTFLSCEKDEASPGSNNSFSCYVNGNNFVAQIDGRKSTATDAILVNDTLTIDGKYIEEGKYERVGFRIENFSGPGTYLLRDNRDNYGHYFLKNPEMELFTTTDEDNPGKVEITRFSPEEEIISGTFSFEVYTGSPDSSFRITDGRFDLSILIYQ